MLHCVRITRMGLVLMALGLSSCTSSDEPKGDTAVPADSAAVDTAPGLDLRVERDQSSASPDAGTDATIDAPAAADATADSVLDASAVDGTTADATADTTLPVGCTLLDDIPTGSLSSWTGSDSGYNPAVSWTEQPMGHQGSNAIYATCSGNTTGYCETENIYKDYATGLQNSSQAALQVFFKATSNQTYFNATLVYAVLLGDDSDTSLGSAGYYLDAGVGEHPARTTPSTYSLMEPTDDADTYRLPLSRAGADIAFTRVRVYFMSYACVGENTSVLDQISLCGGT